MNPLYIFNMFANVTVEKEVKPFMNIDSGFINERNYIQYIYITLIYKYSLDIPLDP